MRGRGGGDGAEKAVFLVPPPIARPRWLAYSLSVKGDLFGIGRAAQARACTTLHTHTTNSTHHSSGKVLVEGVCASTLAQTRRVEGRCNRNIETPGHKALWP